MNFWGLLRHQITCHPPPLPLCQNSVTPVAELLWEKNSLFKLMVVVNGALSSATSSSRRGSALRSTLIGVLICWQFGPAGVEGRLVKEIMLLLDGISVAGKTQERERGFTVMSVTKLSSLCNYLASTKFHSTVAMCLPARVVARSSTPTTASW